MNSWTSTGAILAIAVGCAHIGRSFDATALSWLHPGVTTQEEVRQKLGEPWRAGIDAGDRTWTYGYYEYRVFGESNNKDLVLRFTPAGKLISYTVSTTFPEERAELERSSVEPGSAGDVR